MKNQLISALSFEKKTIVSLENATSMKNKIGNSWGTNCTEFL